MNLIDGILTILEEKPDVERATYQKTLLTHQIIVELKEPLTNHNKTDEFRTYSTTSIEKAAIQMFIKLKSYGL